MNGILVCSGDGQKKNIGDYIQSVAQEQFFDHTDCYVEREHLNTFTAKEKVNVIMNGWFMWHPENFPPSSIINPLFVSFHLVPTIAKDFLTQETIAYLKKYQPIGVRDTGTKELLNSYGIKSYFSGCLTLTLGLKYKSEKRNNNVYFVDPFYDLIGTQEGYGKFRKLLIALNIYIKHFRSLRALKKIFHAEFKTGFHHYSKKLSDWVCCISFYNTYSRIFSDDILLHAEYLTHDLPQSMFKDNDEKMQYARELINKYAQAKLVVTSRIHCALPCIGLDTPTLFVNSDNLQKGAARCGSTGRFGGLINLMNTLYCKGTNFYAADEAMEIFLKEKITKDTHIPTQDKYISIKQELISTVKNWISNN